MHELAIDPIADRPRTAPNCIMIPGTRSRQTIIHPKFPTQKALPPFLAFPDLSDVVNMTQNPTQED